MKQKICILVSLGFIIILSSLSHVFAQKEKEVMKRYDYSSPKASYESLKKAIESKDIEGFWIHTWQIGRVLTTEATYQTTFEKYLQKIKKTIKRPINEEWYSLNSSDNNKAVWIKFTETEFMKESEREHMEQDNVGGTSCVITAQRKNDVKQIELPAINIDGTKEWWISIYPGGE